MRPAAISFLVLILALPRPSSGRLILVRPGGDGDVPTIQSAVAAATHGDTILLANGIFSGEGNRDVRVGPVAMTIRSASGRPDSCIIDCEYRGRAFLFESGSLVEPFRHADARLEGVTITRGRAANGGAIAVGPHAGPIVTRCILRANQADETGGAVSLETTDDPKFESCVIAGNASGESGGAVALCCCASGAFERCTIVGNRAPEGSAFSGGFSGLSIVRTIIAFHQQGATFKCGAGCSDPVTECDVYGNGDDSGNACVGFQPGLNGNVSVDPGFRDVDRMDLRLRPGSPLRPRGSTGPPAIGAALD